MAGETDSLEIYRYVSISALILLPISLFVWHSVCHYVRVECVWWENLCCKDPWSELYIFGCAPHILDSSQEILQSPPSKLGWVTLRTGRELFIHP